MEQDEQQPVGPEQGDNPFGSPPITLVDDGQPPLQPSAGLTCNEAVLALVLSLLGIASGPFCCFGVVTIWMELGALMLAVTARKRIGDNPHLRGEGLARAAICIALIILALYAVGHIFMFVSMGWAARS